MVEQTIDQIGETVKQVFVDFLESFILPNTYLDSDLPDAHSNEFHHKHYLKLIKELKITETTTLLIDFTHFLHWNDRTALTVQENYARLEPYLCQAVQLVVEKYSPDYLYRNNNQTYLSNPGSRHVSKGLKRDFWVSFYNLPKVSRLRELRGEHIGKLDTITGTVTRTSEVRPELLRASFECGLCQTQVHQIEQQCKYTEPLMCQNPVCQNRVAWQLLFQESVFCDWQKIKVQEPPKEIPSGAMPRSLDVIVRHEMVERAKAGDQVRFTGTVIAIPDVSQLVPGHRSEMVSKDSGGRGQVGFGLTGLKPLGVREMSYTLAFLACHCQPMSFTSSASLLPHDDDPTLSSTNNLSSMGSWTQEEIQELHTMVANRSIYNALAKSIAPHIFGHDDIKRGLLLQLISGVHKVTSEGLPLRGDINICIVGDPSTAKSMLLKQVATLSPRAVFTSGKAASAAGLTAAVVKDEETGDFTIEAGALMLADHGICCIDEFDKMDVRDQVAIHEAMEQQTISIAKAGIHATLNARTSILAAANPVHGRYDKTLTLRQNIGLSAPILSRFDLFFVVLDEGDPATDVQLAQHVVQGRREPIQGEYSLDQVRRYVYFAKRFQPQWTPDVAHLIQQQYKELRIESDRKSHRVTVRQLESMIRLTEALAKLHCDEWVRPPYAREAYRLIQKSMLLIESEEGPVLDFQDHPLMTTDPNATTTTLSSSSSNDASMTLVAGRTLPSFSLPSQHKITMSAEELHNMTQLFVLKLQETSEGALRRSSLVQWYLEQMEDTMTSEADYFFCQRKAELVLRHLVKKTHVLIELKKSTTTTTTTTSMGASSVEASMVDEMESVSTSIMQMEVDDSSQGLPKEKEATKEGQVHKDEEEDDKDPFLVLNPVTIPII